MADRHANAATQDRPNLGIAFPDLSVGLTAVAVLESLAGVTYLVDEHGQVLAFSPDPGYSLPQHPFATDGQLYVGLSLFDAISSGEVRDACRTLHQAIWSGERKTFGFEYRCDDPDMRRLMWLALSRIAGDAGPVAVLYQSLLLSETPRAPMRLFEPAARIDRDVAGSEASMATLCSYCHAVAWPVGGEPSEWIEPVDYYRRGGPDHVRVSHGICPACVQRVFEPDAPSG